MYASLVVGDQRLGSAMEIHCSLFWWSSREAIHGNVLRIKPNHIHFVYLEENYFVCLIWIKPFALMYCTFMLHSLIHTVLNIK